MWAVVLFGFLAGLIRSAPAAALVAACTVPILVIQKSNLWLDGEATVTFTQAMVWRSLGETALAVLPAFALGWLAFLGVRRLRRRWGR